MKAIKLIAASCMLIATIVVNAQTKVDTLTNDNIITLTKIGLQPSVIISKIKASVPKFDISTDALIKLGQNGVSSDVINEMIAVVNSKQNDMAKQINSKDPAMMHQVGIYYYNSSDTASPVKKLDKSIVNYKTSSGGYGGFGGSSTTANLSGVESKFIIDNTSPVFYFYFDNNSNSSNWFNSSSPNEFSLVKLIIKKDFRYFKSGSSSYNYGHSSSSEGVADKDKTAFDYVQVKDGIYKVTFKTPLVKGEYCFVFSTNTYMVFDFSIK